MEQRPEPPRLPGLSGLGLDRPERPFRLGVRNLEQAHILDGPKHGIEVLARTEDAGTDHREDHAASVPTEVSTCSNTHAASASTARTSTASYRERICANSPAHAGPGHRTPRRASPTPPPQPPPVRPRASPSARRRARARR